MTNETKGWLDAFPESDHPLDTKRWYDAIINAFRTGIDLDFEEIRYYIKENKNWEEEYVDKFIEKIEIDYSKLKDFFNHIK